MAIVRRSDGPMALPRATIRPSKPADQHGAAGGDQDPRIPIVYAGVENRRSRAPGETVVSAADHLHVAIIGNVGVSVAREDDQQVAIRCCSDTWPGHISARLFAEHLFIYNPHFDLARRPRDYQEVTR